MGSSTCAVARHVMQGAIPARVADALGACVMTRHWTSTGQPGDVRPIAMMAECLRCAACRAIFVLYGAQTELKSLLAGVVRGADARRVREQR